MNIFILTFHYPNYTLNNFFYNKDCCWCH